MTGNGRPLVEAAGAQLTFDEISVSPATDRAATVAAAPPLSERQRERLRLLLSSPTSGVAGSNSANGSVR